MPEREDKPQIRNVKLSDLKPGPIRREALPQNQEDEIRALYGYLSPYLKMTFEQFELGFLRDLNPENEIAHWSRIVAGHQVFLEQFPQADPGHVLGCLLMISMGGQKPPKVPEPLWESVNRFCDGP